MVWEGAVSEEPDCRREPTNVVIDSYAVAVCRNGDVVGRLRKRLLASLIADGGNEENNRPTVGLGSCLRGKTCRTRGT